MKTGKKQKSTTPPPEPTFTVSGWALESGHDRRTIAKKLAGVKPAWIKNGYRHYRRADLEAAFAPSPRDAEKDHLECRRLRAQCDRLEHRLAVDRADFVAKQILSEHLQRFAAAVESTLENREAAMAELLKPFGLDEAGIAQAQALVRAHVSAPILERFHDHFSAFLQPPG